MCDPVTLAVIGGVATAGVAKKALGFLSPPEPPKPPKAPEPVDPNELAKKKAAAADKAKKQAIGAYGHEDTIKTSRLGSVTPGSQKAFKELLGG